MGINKDLGLPVRDGMQRVAICFDIDGTLIENDKEHHRTILLIRVIALQKWKNVDVYVWSGGGKDYANTIHRRLELPDSIKAIGKLEHSTLRDKYSAILAIDDIQDTNLGDINLIVRNK